VIILEDDFIFMGDNNFEKVMNDSADIDCDILLLCNNIRETDLLPINDRFLRVRNVSWTSGHLIRETLYDPLIQNLQEGIKEMEIHKHLHDNIHRPFHLDVYWNKLWTTYFAMGYKENIATQRHGFSDILKKNCDRALAQN
jgi:hypothetical protein